MAVALWLPLPTAITLKEKYYAHAFHIIATNGA